MAISFGRRGTGGSGGSSRVGFVEGRQNSTAITINNHASNFTNPTYTTRSWQLTNKDGGKAEIVFSSLITISNGASTTNVRYSADLQVASYSTLNNSPSNTDFIDIPNLVPSNGNLIFDDLQHYDNEASFYHTISGAIPFNLSVLPSSVTNNRYLNFRVRLRVSADGSPTIQATNGYVVLKSFGVGAGSTDINGGDIRDGTITANELANNSVTRPKIINDAINGDKIADDAIGNEHIATDAVRADQIQANAVVEAKIATGAVTENKIGTDAVTQSKIADGAVDSNRLADGAVSPSKIAGVNVSGASAGQVLKLNTAKTGFDFADDNNSGGGGGGGTPDDGSVTPAKMAGVNVSSATAGQVMKLNTAKTGFVFADDNTGSGGGISSVEPANLDGVTGGSGDASKFIKTDSTGDEFEAVSSIQPSDINGNIPASKLGLTGGGSDAGKFVQLDSAGTGFAAHGDFTPSDIGLTEGNTIQGRLVSINSTGDGFTTTAAQQAGAAPTLDNITGGPLALNKGGTGYAADSLDALRQRLGVGSSAITDPELVRSTDADTQKDNTIHRFDSSTSNRPTGASNGIIVRVGNDQWMLDVDDGQQWKREISNTGTGLWSTPVAATLTNLTTESDFRTLAEGGRGWTSSDTWLPSFSDGSKPAKVIVGRNGNYLVCIDRNNFFWAPRPTVSTWAEIPWRWEGTSTIPAGLYYTGGETDERLIPAGEDAVIGGKTNIPGENFVSLLVDHSVASGTSTFTGYFIDDDSGQTIRSTTNTVGNTTGTWSRILVGSDGLAADAVNAAAIADGAVGADAIDNDIIVEDAGSSEAVFLGIVPSIDDLTFTGYTFKTSLTDFPVGGAYYDVGSRTMYVRHQPSDIHLQDLFAIDYEVSIEKDSTNYIRGVFDQISNFNLPGVGQITGGIFRAADLDTQGTLANDDTVEIKGHKAVITKTDTIGTVNLADDAITNAKIADDAVDTAQLADGAVDTDRLEDDAVTPVKVGGITTGSSETGKVVVLDSTNGTAFTTIPRSDLGGTPANNSITNAMLQDNIITPAEVAGVTASGNGGKVVAINTAGNAFELVEQSGGSGSGGAPILMSKRSGSNVQNVSTNNAWTALDFNTDAWQLSNKSTGLFVVSGLGFFSTSGSGGQPSLAWRAATKLQVRWSDTADGTYSSWTDVPPLQSVTDAPTNSFAYARSSDFDLGPSGNQIPSPSGGKMSVLCGYTSFALSSLPSGATDGKYIQFRLAVQPRFQSADSTASLHFQPNVGMAVIIEGEGGSGSGGGGTPADGSITTAKLADDAVTADKLAAGAVSVSDIASIYTQSASTYTATNTQTPTSGQAWYAGATGTGTIYINFTSNDSGVNASLATGEVIVLWASNTKYRMLRITGNTSPSSGVRAIAGTIVGGAGTIAVNDTLRVLYDSTTAYDGVIKVAPDGTMTTGSVSVPSLGIAGAAADTGDVISVGSSGTFAVASPYDLGMVKASMIMRSNTGGSGDGHVINNVSNTRKTWHSTRAMQTGAWVMANKSTDWLRVNAAGLYFFGFITAQPIVADLELWVRWRDPATETFQSWGTNLTQVNDGANISTNTRVAAVAMGGDRLQITKLFAGGIDPATAPVDCAVPSGTKMLKLSQLPSDIVDGDEVQFTIGFSSQGTSASPNYTVRNLFLQVDVLDGSNIHANY